MEIGSREIGNRFGALVQQNWQQAWPMRRRTDSRELRELEKRGTMRNNTRWKSLQSREELLKFLEDNPTMAVFDTREKESRYVVRYFHDRPTGITVDGRSFRAAFFDLIRLPDGGWVRRAGREVTNERSR